MRARASQLEADIEAHEHQFPLLLLAVLLPLLALPFADLAGQGWHRYGLPVAANLLIWQSIRALPPWRRQWAGLSLDHGYRQLGMLAGINTWIPFLLGYQVHPAVRLCLVAISAAFYLITAVRMIQVLAGSRSVNDRTLCLGAAGYIQMGLTGGQLATLLELVDSDSFNLGGMASGEEVVARLSYFSFVTIGTLGYGDVVPRSPIGESFVVLLSICSTLYVSLLIGLLLSRYINSRSRPIASDSAASSHSGLLIALRPFTPRGKAIRAREPSFPWFLLATLLPLLLMPYTNLDGNLFEMLCLPLVNMNLVIQSLRIMPSTRPDLQLLGGQRLYQILAFISALAVWMLYLIGQQTPTPLLLLCLGFICCFSLLTAVRIVQILAHVEGVNGRCLCLGSAGYVQLGLTAGQLATALEVLQPNSFNLGTMLPGSEVIERLTYFSFVTLGSIGYGDVLPKNPGAEFFAVALSITGTLYVSLMIGLLLSRYINDHTHNPQSSTQT